MNKNQLSQHIGNIDDRLVQQAEQIPNYVMQHRQFMRMKEDAMMNGQLKPAQNLQQGVVAEYITWLTMSIILAIGYNINKLHHKIQSERTGQHLFSLKKTA